MKLDEAIRRVENELGIAFHTFGQFNTFHEGYAVLLEEVEELWEEIKKHDPKNIPKIQKEAVQVAAMAIRILVDLP